MKRERSLIHAKPRQEKLGPENHISLRARSNQRAPTPEICQQIFVRNFREKKREKTGNSRKTNTERNGNLRKSLSPVQTAPENRVYKIPHEASALIYKNASRKSLSDTSHIWIRVTRREATQATSSKIQIQTRCMISPYENLN